MGFGGWKVYNDHVAGSGGSGCAADEPVVHNWFWHIFDILLVIKISLAAAVLWTIAYWEGEKAKDDFPASDPNQKNCQILKVEAAGTTELTYSIDPNWGESHAEGVCSFMKSDAYYAHMMFPSIMVLVGIRFPLPNLTTIVTTVLILVFIMELLRIVLDFCKSNSAG